MRNLRWAAGCQRLSRLALAPARLHGSRAAAATAPVPPSTPPDVLACAWQSKIEPAAVYVHLPFCKRKCYYCDFPVVATGPDAVSRGALDKFEEYVERLCTEIRLHARLNAHPLQTVFFGGGTPSLIPPPLLARIISALEGNFGIAAGAEVSMEADPGTFDAPRLQAYMSEGVTRFSMGVQAFDEELLQACGRAHTLADVHAAIDAMHTAAPPSWSLDLITGLPGLSEENWRHSVACAIAAQPPHVSVYDLQVEEGTPFARWQDAGKLHLPEEDAAVRMFSEASTSLRAAGYGHYELSNYARRGHECRHNLVYWLGHSYYAFGVGASSFVDGRRYSRPRTMAGWRRYVDSMQDGCGIATAGGVTTCAASSSQHSHATSATDRGGAGAVAVLAGAPAQREAGRSSERGAAAAAYVAGALEPELTREDRMLEALMLMLRLRRGVDLQWFGGTFGEGKLQALLAAAQPHVDTGHAQVLPSRERNGTAALSGEDTGPGAARLSEQLAVQQIGQHGARLVLTDPKGLLLSNSVISDLFVALT